MMHWSASGRFGSIRWTVWPRLAHAAAYEDNVFQANLPCRGAEPRGAAAGAGGIWALWCCLPTFLFVRHPGHDAATLAAQLRERAVLVRHFARPERIAQYLRISVGTPARCDALVQALRELV